MGSSSGIEDPDHPKALIAQRRHACDAQVTKRFFGLSPLAVKYHAGLLERRGNAIAHVRKIVALADIHGDEAVVRAMTDALTSALLDRLLHHAETVVIEGNSYRMRDQIET